MKKGGNAFDAMVATELALEYLIHRPEILVAVVLWFSEKQRETGAPDYQRKTLAATKDMYLIQKEM
jgi:hypothetical protein